MLEQGRLCNQTKSICRSSVSSAENVLSEPAKRFKKPLGGPGQVLQESSRVKLLGSSRKLLSELARVCGKLRRSQIGSSKNLLAEFAKFYKNPLVGAGKFLQRSLRRSQLSSADNLSSEPARFFKKSLSGIG